MSIELHDRAVSIYGESLTNAGKVMATSAASLVIIGKLHSLTGNTEFTLQKIAEVAENLKNYSKHLTGEPR